MIDIDSRDWHSRLEQLGLHAKKDKKAVIEMRPLEAALASVRVQGDLFVEVGDWKKMVKKKKLPYDWAGQQPMKKHRLDRDYEDCNVCREMQTLRLRLGQLQAHKFLPSLGIVDLW